MQNQAAQQVAKALREANNVMVTVKNSPSVDELTAAVALTLMLNHMNKHATTVFSGAVPSTIEFLQPEMAIESNTDSLRDFIISLDKSKADKLRYKVEDNVVRIFITPYKTSITDQDLEFSQGEFNVDVVVALGVVGREDFDQAVSTHGRILHNATIVGVTNQEMASQIGTINWHDQQASSVSEMIASISESLGPNILDGQIATALMTGIVAETDRFRNTKTTPRVMSLSSLLMASGANQQLIAEQLEQTLPVDPILPIEEATDDGNGTLDINHKETGENEVQKIHIDDHGNLDVHQNYQPGPPEERSQGFEQPATDNEPAEKLGIPSAQPPMEVQSSTPEKPVSEVPAHEYIAEPKPAQTAETGMLDDQNGVTGGLFSNSLNKEEKQDSPPEPPINEKTLEHRHKVINPIDHDPPQAAGNLSPTLPGYQPPKTVRELIAAEEKGGDKTDSIPVNDTQTLSDLEKVVDSSSTQQIATSSKLEDYTGSVRQPASPLKEDVKTEESKVAELIASEVAEKEEPKKPKKEEKPTAYKEPPQVINPNSAPAVPPPIVPQEASGPQFYEADGSKSNSLLKPTEE